MAVLGKKVYTISVLLFIIMTASTQLFSAPASQSYTAVLGFIDSAGTDVEMNVLLTRSFISYFSRIPGAKIIPFATSDKLVREKGFFRQKTAGQDLSIQIGQMLGCRQVITGSYKVDSAQTKVEIDIVDYDTVTGEILFKRHYEGKAGPGLLDTIDTVRKNFAGLIAGREIPMGSLKISVTNSNKMYEVLLGGNPDGIANPIYQKKIPSGSPFDISLRCTNSGVEVFRTNITLKAGQDVSLIYYPTAPILIQSAIYPIQIWNNGKKAGIIETNDTFIFNGLPADSTYHFFLQNYNLRSIVRDVRISEGKPSALTFDTNNFYSRYHYRGLQPAWDFLLPGVVQLQAQDYGMSALFAGLWIADIGAMAYCLYYYIAADDIARNSPNQNFREEVKLFRDLFGGLSIVSGVLLVGIVTGSWLHANGMMVAEDMDQRYSLDLKTGSDPGFELTLTYYFN